MPTGHGSWREIADLPDDIATAAAAKRVALAALTEQWSQLHHVDIAVEPEDAQTFKLSVSAAIPSAVTVRLFDVEETEGRTVTIRDLFASHRVSRQHIARGVDWTIEAYEGTCLMSPHDSELFWNLPSNAVLPLEPLLMEQVGQLLGKMHSMPIEWFEPIETELRVRYSTLLHTPKGHSLWLFGIYASEAAATFDDRLWHLSRDMVEGWLDLSLGEPFHPASSRLVCSNGDFGPQNIIQAESKPLTIVSPSKCLVQHAVLDVAYAAVDWCSKKSNFHLRQALVRGYLQRSGLPDDDTQVEMLLLDAEVASLHQPGSLLSQENDHFSLASFVQCMSCSDSVLSSELLREKRSFCDGVKQWLLEARADADLCRSVVERGIRRCKPFKALVRAHTESVLRIQASHDNVGNSAVFVNECE
jgi:hypothetical protein